MKLLNKLKNVFFEEEYIEVEEPTPKVEEVAKKIEPREVKKEPIIIEPEIEEIKVSKEEKVEKKKETYNDSELVNKNSKLPQFDDEDFIQTTSYREVKEDKPKKLYGEDPSKLYKGLSSTNTDSSKNYSSLNKKTFQPTPLISPIYGILDKNYRKEEVVDKKEKPSSYVSRKNVDLDSIRQKAFGQVSESVNEIYEDVDLKDDDYEEDNLLYDMTQVDNKPRVNQVTIADAEEYFSDLGLEYNIDYRDARYERATGRRADVVDRVEPQDSSVSNNVSEDNSGQDKLEDNLFDLIDSIYEESGE